LMKRFARDSGLSFDIDHAREMVKQALGEIKKVYVGKEDLVKLSMATLLSSGHLLIEGLPGTGKTLLAKTLARVIGGTYRRIQGHPDTLPSDITGFHVYRPDGSSSFVRGPVFSNILVIDELNRVPSRSQAALIEAMQEYQVTVEGVTYSLPRPFMVIATMIPQEYASGAYGVIETLIDRFATSLPSLYNPPEEELEIVSRSDYVLQPPVEQVLTPSDVTKISELIAYWVHVEENVKKYIVDLVSYLRSSRAVLYGPSHRASAWLYRVSRTLAFMEGRDYVIPDDVKALAVPVLAHRVKIREEFEVEGVTPKSLVEEALNRVPVPK